jgi:hypothetical protein
MIVVITVTNKTVKRAMMELKTRVKMELIVEDRVRIAKWLALTALLPDATIAASLLVRNWQE